MALDSLSVAARIRANGGVLSYRDLDAMDVPRSAVAAARAGREIVQVRERWFAVPDAPSDVVRAGADLQELASSDDAVLHLQQARQFTLFHEARIARFARRNRA